MSVQIVGQFDTSVFDRVIETGSVEQRQSLAHQLANFFSDMEAPPEERTAVVPSIIRLATDPVQNVRATLAAGLAKAHGLHPDVLFTIVADCDEIALDFLLRTPSLDAWQMMAILKVGETSKQVVIASRGDVSSHAVEHIVEHSAPEVAASLLANPCVAIEVQHMKRLYVRFPDEPCVVDMLLERADLPLEIRIMQAKRTSTRVYHLMARRGWMAANDAEEFVTNTEESTYIKILEDAKIPELDKLIPFMCDQQLLTPSIILRAACAGDLELVERALSYLASVPARRIRSLMSGRGARSVLQKAGMPDSAHMLLRAVFDVAEEARSNNNSLSVEQFGCKLIEFLMTRYPDLVSSDKARLLGLLAKFGGERTSRIANKVQEDLSLAA